jgi:hypothetical protein
MSPRGWIKDTAFMGWAGAWSRPSRLCGRMQAIELESAQGELGWNESIDEVIR